MFSQALSHLAMTSLCLELAVLVLRKQVSWTVVHSFLMSAFVV